MKILLMVPIPSFMQEMLNSPDPDIPKFPDLGLGYIATALRKTGHEVFIRSWNMAPSVEDFKEWVANENPDIIGIKVFTKDVRAANKTIRLIKSLNRNIYTVIGGPHPSSSLPEDILVDFPEIDFAFRGEAEIGLPILADFLSENKAKKGDPPTGTPDELLKKIPGLVWRNQGEVYSNERIFIKELDKFGMPLWELMNPRDYHPPIVAEDGKGNLAPLIVTRGCPGNCVYCCAYNVNGKAVRIRSPNHVIEEIEFLYNHYNVRQLTIMDTRFLHKKEVVKEICEKLISKTLRVSWDCICYESTNYLDKGLLVLMRQAGCETINIGIESGSNRMRKIIKKEGTVEEIKQNVLLIKNMGIKVRAFFMFGFPQETKEDMKETMKFAFSLPVDFLHFDVVCPHPGTETLRFLKEKYMIGKINWKTFDVYSSPYHLSDLSSQEVYKILKQARLKNLFTVRELKRKMAKIRQRLKLIK